MTYDNIENKIMKYLYSNPNTRFNQYSLYNKLLDNIEVKNSLTQEILKENLLIF
jgi:hypothetical protein